MNQSITHSINRLIKQKYVSTIWTYKPDSSVNQRNCVANSDVHLMRSAQNARSSWHWQDAQSKKPHNNKNVWCAQIHGTTFTSVTLLYSLPFPENAWIWGMNTNITPWIFPEVPIYSHSINLCWQTLHHGDVIVNAVTFLTWTSLDI